MQPETATGPYREPDESKPHPHRLLIKIHASIILECTSMSP